MGNNDFYEDFISREKDGVIYGECVVHGDCKVVQTKIINSILH